MAERFEVIDKFCPTKDFLECPVEIDKWAILYDKLTDSSVLQIKFRRLLNIPISSVSIQIMCYDDYGYPLNSNEYIKYTYSSNNLIYETFGADRIVKLNFSNVVRVDIIIDEVISEHKVIWKYNEELHVNIEKQIKFPTVLHKQVVREFGESFSSMVKYIPMEKERTWQCTCGKLNNSSKCLRCKLDKETVFKSLNLNCLTANFGNHLKEEEEKAKIRNLELERRSKQQIKQVKNVITITLATMFALIASWSVNRAVKEISFNSAKADIKQQRYSEAIKTFNSLPQEIYKDRIITILEKEAEKLLTDFKNEEIKFDKANAGLKSLKQYSNADQITIYSSKKDKNINVLDSNLKQIKNLNKSRTGFLKGEEYKKNEEYCKAIDSFSAVIKSDSNYKDAQKEIVECENIIKQETKLKLEDYKTKSDYISAIELIDSVKDYIHDEELNDYSQYFRAIKKGEDCLKDGAHYWRNDLYLSPNINAKSRYYISGSGTAEVYDYSIDSDNRTWAKIKCDGEFYWIII